MRDQLADLHAFVCDRHESDTIHRPAPEPERLDRHSPIDAGVRFQESEDARRRKEAQEAFVASREAEREGEAPNPDLQPAIDAGWFAYDTVAYWLAEIRQLAARIGAKSSPDRWLGAFDSNYYANGLTRAVHRLEQLLALRRDARPTERELAAWEVVASDGRRCETVFRSHAAAEERRRALLNPDDWQVVGLWRGIPDDPRCTCYPVFSPSGPSLPTATDCPVHASE